MSDGNTALQWVLDTEEEYLSEFFDDDILIEDFSDIGDDNESDAIIPEWVRDEFEYDMQAYED